MTLLLLGRLELRLVLRALALHLVHGSLRGEGRVNTTLWKDVGLVRVCVTVRKLSGSVHVGRLLLRG